jgi:hypothetical protein
MYHIPFFSSGTILGILGKDSLENILQLDNLD